MTLVFSQIGPSEITKNELMCVSSLELHGFEPHLHYLVTKIKKNAIQ